MWRVTEERTSPRNDDEARPWRTRSAPRTATWRAREGRSAHNGHEGVAVVTDTPGAELARAEERSQRTRRAVTVVVRRNGHHARRRGLLPLRAVRGRSRLRQRGTGADAAQAAARLLAQLKLVQGAFHSSMPHHISPRRSPFHGGPHRSNSSIPHKHQRR